jgi:hypothetical protein
LPCLRCSRSASFFTSRFADNPSRLLRVRQKNNQLELRIGEVARNISRDIA